MCKINDFRRAVRGVLIIILDFICLMSLSCRVGDMGQKKELTFNLVAFHV
jgi:hypothetical protein